MAITQSSAVLASNGTALTLTFSTAATNGTGSATVKVNGVTRSSTRSGSGTTRVLTLGSAAGSTDIVTVSYPAGYVNDGSGGDVPIATDVAVTNNSTQLQAHGVTVTPYVHGTEINWAATAGATEYTVKRNGVVVYVGPLLKYLDPVGIRDGNSYVVSVTAGVSATDSPAVVTPIQNDLYKDYWFVRTDGNDSNGGRKPTDAFLTLAKAYSVANGDDVIQAQPAFAGGALSSSPCPILFVA